MKIPFNIPFLPEKANIYIQEALESRKHCGNYMFGQRCIELMKEKYGFHEVFLTTSCTTAMEMGALLADLKVGDEVLFNGNYKGLVKQIHTSGKLKGMIDVIKKGRSSVTTVHASYVKKVNESVDEAKKADLSKFTTKNLRDLYAVLDGKANTPKEKAAVAQLREELVKRKVIKKEELTEEMHDCIQDYQGMGYSYSEAMKKCKGSVWDEKGGKKGKRFKRESKEDTTMKITKSRLKEIIREELVEFKSFPKSSKALKGKDIVSRIKKSTDKGYKTFFGKKTLDTIAKKSKLTAKELDELLPDSVPGNLIYNLWNEDEVNG